MKHYISNATYIMFDGTSHYGIYGCDVEDDIEENDSEVVSGPFNEWNDEIDRKIENLNKEADGEKLRKY